MKLNRETRPWTSKFLRKFWMWKASHLHTNKYYLSQEIWGQGNKFCPVNIPLCRTNNKESRKRMQKSGPPDSWECSHNNGFAVPDHMIKSEASNSSTLYNTFLGIPGEKGGKWTQWHLISHFIFKSHGKSVHFQRQKPFPNFASGDIKAGTFCKRECQGLWPN